MFTLSSSSSKVSDYQELAQIWTRPRDVLKYGQPKFYTLQSDSGRCGGNIDDVESSRIEFELNSQSSLLGNYFRRDWLIMQDEGLRNLENDDEKELLEEGQKKDNMDNPVLPNEDSNIKLEKDVKVKYLNSKYNANDTQSEGGINNKSKLAQVLDAILESKEAEIDKLSPFESVNKILNDKEIYMKPKDTEDIPENGPETDTKKAPIFLRKSSKQFNRSVSLFVDQNSSKLQPTNVKPKNLNTKKISVSKSLETKDIKYPKKSRILKKLPEGYGIDEYGFIEEKSIIETQILRINTQDQKKWENMLSNNFANVNRDKLLKLCARGIPKDLRGDVWYYLTRSFSLDNFNQNFWTQVETCTLPSSVEAEIRRDLHRQNENHFLFYIPKNTNSLKKNAYGHQELFKVLKALALFDPKMGFCQAHGPIAATLIMHTCSEQAFWILSYICTFYLPKYYENLDYLQFDSEIFQEGLRRFSKSGSKMLLRLNINKYFLIEWFLCIYLRTFPFTYSLIIFDLFILKGKKILFKIGYSLLDQLAQKKPKDEAEFNIFLVTLKKDANIINFDKMISNALKLRLTNEWIEQRLRALLKKNAKKHKSL